MWVTGMGHAPELRHIPDSEPGLWFSESGKTRSREIYPIKKKKSYFFCKFAFLTLGRQALLEPLL